jgi:EAL and modified HD-GYP domain-containing signal transduction protein
MTADAKGGIMSNDNNNSNIAPLIIARQPIFDRSHHLWGYELIPVLGPGEPGRASVAVDLAASTYVGLQEVLDRGKKIVVRFSEKCILEDLPYALPPGRAVIRISGVKKFGAELQETLRRLKGDGCLIFVEVGDTPVDKSLLSMVDFSWVSVEGRNRNEILTLLKELKPYGSGVVAARVNDQRMLGICKESGFELFQGSFFKQPETISVKKVSSTQASRFQIIRMIEQEDPDFAELAKIIGSDVSIGFRLFTFINSASFGFRQKISSIREAITMLGWHKVKSWLRVVILTDIAQNSNASELVQLSAQRGKFLEQVAIDHDFWDFNPESLLLLGMFSLLDAVINQPMTEIVTYLPLEEKLKSTLCREPNSEYLPFLTLTERFEEGHWESADAMVQQLGLDRKKVRTAFENAVKWANEMSGLI